MKRYLFAIVILLITNAAYAQPGAVLPAGNLLAWYPFCNDTTDHGGTGYHLNNLNVAATTGRYNQPRSAWMFNGFNSDMHYTTTFPLSTLTGNIGYSVWIYPTGFQNSVILHNGNPNLDGIGIVMNDGAGGPGDRVAVTYPGFTQQFNVPVTINQWHHLVLTRTGNGFYFYVDTIQVGYYVPPVPPGFNPPTTVFQLGIDNSDGTDAFLGKIDDVAIYERLLSNLDVRKLYHFMPDISFTLGPDRVTCADTVYLHPLSPADSSYYVNFLYGGSYDYNWYPSPVNNNSLQREIFSKGLPSLPVTRILEIADNPHRCPSRDTITVTHVIPQLNLGADTIFCAGGSLVLDAGPATGATFLWSTGSTADTLPVSTTGYYSVIKDSVTMAGSTIITCTAIDTIRVQVAPPITATLTHPGAAPGSIVVLPRDTILCLGGSLNIAPIETYGTPTFSWQDGITTVSSFSVTGTGTYWIKVVDSSCIATDTVTITIVYDTVTIFTPDTAVCKGATFVAQASSASDITYQWTPTTGIPVSSVPTPTITADTSAWYYLTATIIVLTPSYQVCHIQDSFYVDVQPIPTVNMGGNREVCKFDTLHITPVVAPGWYTSYSYDWTPGTFLDDSTAPSVVFTAGDTSKIVLVVSTPAGCSGADSIIINKYNGNFASMATDTVLCPGDSVKLFPLSTEPGPTYYVWHPSTFIDDSTSTTPTIKPIQSIAYDIIAYSQYGCKDTLSYSITVKPAAVITLTDSVVLFPGETYQISPTTNCHYHTWFPDIGLSDTGIINPIASPDVSTKYIVLGRTEDGCWTTDSINIRVDPNTIILVPNAFTPGTGVNNTIHAILKGIARLRHFRIYNRWGGLVFEGKNINDGWDGTIGGVPQPMGVYIYEAEAVTDKGKIIQKQGNITLLR